MTTRLDKFFQTLAELFDLLAELVDELHEAKDSSVNGDEIRGAMFLLDLYGKENSLNDFLNAYEFWKDFHLQDAKSLSLDFKTLLGLEQSIDAFLVPMRVYNANPTGAVMNVDTVGDIFSFLKILVRHAVFYEEESRKTAPPAKAGEVVSKRKQIPLDEVRKNFKIPAQ